MPKGFNKRGVHGVNVMYQTSIESRFEGATGTITDINPKGTHGIPRDFAAKAPRLAVEDQPQRDEDREHHVDDRDQVEQHEPPRIPGDLHEHDDVHDGPERP